MITVYTETTRIAEVPPYLFFAGLATVAALIPFVVVLLKKDEDLRWFGWQFGLAGLGLLLGGRFFGFLVEVANCLQEGRALTFADVRRSAFVAYGGLLGFIAVYRLVTGWIVKHRQTFAHIPVQMDTLAVVIPLFHGIARFGCLFAGCCYGKEWHGFLAVHYIGPDGSERWCFPVQLLETLCLFLLCLCMLLLYRKKRFSGQLVLLYIAGYAVCRFCLEFLRGDAVRGVYGGLSFSQFVSMGLLLVLALWGGWHRYRGRHAPKLEEESFCKS